MRSLREALERTPTPLLREMARFWDVPTPEKAGRPALLAGLLAQMGQPEVVRRVLRRLDREEREALRAVLAAGGRLPAPTMTRLYGPLRPAHLTPADPSRLNPTERLHRRGLLFRAFSAWEEWRGLTFFVPAELWPLLPPVPRERPSDLLQTLPPQEVAAVPAALFPQRDMAVLLALCRRERYPLLGPGDWPEELAGALGEALAPAEEGYVPFILHLARQAGLLAADLGGVLRPTAQGQQWLHATPALRVQILFQAWREHPRWDDLGNIPELRVERFGPADLAAPRERALRHLAAIPAGRWLVLSSWLQAVEAADPDLLRAGGASSRFRVYRRKTKETLSGPSSWNEVEGRYLAFLVQGPLHWLGLVELGQGPGAESAFRLTPLGWALLHPEAGLPGRDDETIVVEGTFEVWVPPEASPHAVLTLETWAQPVRRDRLFQYRLTRPALHRAMQRGERVEWLLESLSRYGRGPVPQNVAYTLREWAASYGRTRLRRPVLLTAAEAGLLEEILADPAVQAACGERLSPTAVEVPTEKVAALVERLDQTGHLPQVEEGLLPEGEHLTLTLSLEQGAALLSLLWAWLKSEGKSSPALVRLAEALERLLPPEGRSRARRQKGRHRRERPPAG